MVPFYAISLVAGIVTAVPFVVGFGPRPPRAVTASLLGAGLAGLSSTFAGWSAPLAFVAALVGSGVLAGLALVFGAAGRSDT